MLENNTFLTQEFSRQITNVYEVSKGPTWEGFSNTPKMLIRTQLELYSYQWCREGEFIFPYTSFASVMGIF